MKLLILSLLVGISAQAKTTIVAVIDTGYRGATTHLCPTGSFDFVDGKAQVGLDTWGHGTKVIGAIEANAKNSDYCIQVYKVFGTLTPANLIVRAINLAAEHHVNVLNLSFEGQSPMATEKAAIAYALSIGIKVFVAAGNEGLNLDAKCGAYPACYGLKGMNIIGSKPIKGRNTGNHGHIVTQKEEFCFDGTCGTSLSTAIATGKYISGGSK